MKMSFKTSTAGLWNYCHQVPIDTKSIFPSSCTPWQKARTFAFFQQLFPGWSNICQQDLSILKQGLLKV